MSFKKLAKFLVQKYSKVEEGNLKFNFLEFDALRLYQTIDKTLFSKYINDFLENKQNEPEESVISIGNIDSANGGNITVEMNNNVTVVNQNNTLTILGVNAQYNAINKMGVNSNQAPFSEEIKQAIFTLKDKMEKYIENKYWPINGVCKDITESSECPPALRIPEIGSHIVSFLVNDSSPLSIADRSSIEIIGLESADDISV